MAMTPRNPKLRVEVGAEQQTSGLLNGTKLKILSTESDSNGPS